MPEVDHFLGTGAYAEIASIVSDAQAKRVIVPDPDYVHSASTPRVNSLARHTAYLKIAEGCDNACAFCIIPKLRGPQRSRTVDDVVAEAEALAAQGVVELTSWPRTSPPTARTCPARPRLHHLLPELCKVEGVRWIRLHYAYPRVFPDELIEVIAREPKIAKYLDMPLQHSSDRLLSSMKRGRDVEVPAGAARQAARARPGHRPAHPLIVGLPGETEEDFETCSASSASSASSGWASSTTRDEEGTAAAEMAGQVPERVEEGAAARDHGDPAAHHPASRRPSSGSGSRCWSRARPRDRAPAGGPPRGAGARRSTASPTSSSTCRARRWPTRASSSPSRSPRRTTTTWWAGWWPARRGGPDGGSPRRGRRAAGKRSALRVIS